MNLEKIAELFCQPVPSNLECTGICIDSRKLMPGELFIAIQGDTFDGHNFIHEVEAKGAVAVVVSYFINGITIPQFVVPDTVIALANIAKAHRQTIHCPVIALTGSNGKTSVKEMIAAILPQPSLATKGNLNNHIGAPLSVMNLTCHHRYAVFELGANNPGEIAHTVAIVEPDVTLINNIAPAHVEGFGSIEGVAKAKGEIHQGLVVTGTAIVNDDDAYAHFWDDALHGRKIIRFSSQHEADIYAQNVRIDDAGCGHFSLVVHNDTVEIDLQVPGMHNVQNALAAAACCYAVGLTLQDIQQGLNRFTGVEGRMTIRAGINQSVVIDDTYNANLRSVVAGLEFLAKRPGKKIFVFGDMGELGEWAVEHHKEVGSIAKQLGINKLFSCGSNSALTSDEFGVGGSHYSSQEELVQNLLREVDSNTTILVKGSRSSAMEKIVHKLLN